MHAQKGPSTGQLISIDRVEDALSFYPDETQIVAVAVPIGIQVQLFYGAFEFEAAFYFPELTFVSARYSQMVETIDITNIISLIPNIPTTITGNFVTETHKVGDIDVCGVLYIEQATLNTINIELAKRGRETFRDVTTLVQYSLIHGEFVEHLLFAPNWSHSLAAMRDIETYSEIMRVLSLEFNTLPKLVTSVKYLENIRGFYNTLLEKAKLQFRSIAIFNNDVRKAHRLSSVESQIIAEIHMADPIEYAVIQKIALEPDRFGRIRPSMTTTATLPSEHGHTKIRLVSTKELLNRGYARGDKIEITTRSGYVFPGNIIEKKAKEEAILPVPIKCSYCHKPFARHDNGEFYCRNVKCPMVVFERLHFACSRHVLCLPFDAPVLRYFIFEQKSVRNLADLLYLDWSKLIQYYDTEHTELIQSICHKLLVSVQKGNIENINTENIVIKFLTALSIPNLYTNNIIRLAEAFSCGTWKWAELSTMLTDTGMLRSFGINFLDAAAIANAAIRRVDELDAMSREL